MGLCFQSIKDHWKMPNAIKSWTLNNIQKLDTIQYPTKHSSINCLLIKPHEVCGYRLWLNHATYQDRLYFSAKVFVSNEGSSFVGNQRVERANEGLLK